MSGMRLAGTDWQIILGIVAVAAVCNTACAMLGCYLVLRRMSLLGDAISHAVVAGVVLAFLIAGSALGWPILVGAMIVGFLTTFLTQTLHSFGKVPEDASMGVVFTALFALGVVLLPPEAQKAHIDLDCILYGKIEFAGLDVVEVPWLGFPIPRTLETLAPALVATVAFVLLFWKELKICSFDPELATAMGINANRVHYLLMGMVAVVTVASLEAVGAILVVAMLVVPAATAHLLTDRLSWLLVWAVTVGLVAALLVGVFAALDIAGGSVAGMEWTRYLAVNGAGMMAVIAGVLFLLAVFLAPRRGLGSRLVHQLRLALRIAREDVVAVLYRAEEKAGQPEAAEGFSWTQCLRAAGGGVIGWLAVRGLWRHGQIQRDESGAFRLTEQGRKQAQSYVRSHRLWETYIGEHFDLPLDHLHEPAERIEHFIGPHLQEELARELAAPERDPHGKPIPPKPDGAG